MLQLVTQGNGQVGSLLGFLIWLKSKLNSTQFSEISKERGDFFPLFLIIICWLVFWERNPGSGISYSTPQLM